MYDVKIKMVKKLLSETNSYTKMKQIIPMDFF